MLRKQQQLQPPSPEAQDLLAQLHDIQEPAPVSWWPPAPGWWLLALLILLSLLGITLWIRHRRKQAERNRYKIEAVALLNAVDVSRPEATGEINEILKRVAVTTFSRAHCGNLIGSAWLGFLENSASLKCPDEAREALLEQLYRGSSKPENSEAFRQYAIQWVLQHQLTAQDSEPQVSKEHAGV
ncbi:DUF4381 domain-containing protein [Microbulbifer sp. CnH-101-G]|uniref:DUF4381 domain-containing protein n=1 Tax=Microbulbifer sp. CnH-101-G TaxID=3243393 RepID=UPI00403A5ADA